jgi:hypothetical protein
MKIIRRSLLRKLIFTPTAFRRYTFWLTPAKENSIGYFWPRKSGSDTPGGSAKP